MPGVVAVYTAADFDLPDEHGFIMLPPTMNRPPLAQDKVRFVGDIVAMVVAETKAAGHRRGRSGDRRLRPAARGRRPRGRARGRRAGRARGAGFQRRERDGHRAGRGRARRRRRRRATDASSTSASRPCRWSRPASSRCPASPTAVSTLWLATQGPHGVRDELAVLLGLDPAKVRGAQRVRSAAASARSRA